MNAVTVIPARLASSRLPNKVLADIAGKPMILHVVDRAREAGIGPVLVAAGDQEIVDVCHAAGVEAVLTDPALPSGSDRIKAALDIFDPDRSFDLVVNVQGDLPTVEPHVVRTAVALMERPDVDIGTVAAEIDNEHDKTNPDVNKAVFGADGRALYFTKAQAPANPGPLYHHIGLYVYRRAALERFVALPPSMLEQREKLEQLRALENGMRIDVAIVDTVPLGVDGPADLEKARAMLSASAQ